MVLKNIQIRETSADDLGDIIAIEESAFETDAEAKLTVDLLHDPTAAPTLSLLALRDNKAVGHVLFSRVYINGKKYPLSYIMAPLAVMPAYQKRGIGGTLIIEGLRILRERNAKIVFLLGHTEYYPRFGFALNAASRGYDTPYPDSLSIQYRDCWMSLALTDEKLPTGRIICSDTLNKPSYWG